MPGKNNGRAGGRRASRAAAAKRYRDLIEEANNASSERASEARQRSADLLDQEYGFSAAEKGHNP